MMSGTYDRTRVAVLLCSVLNAILGMFGIWLIVQPDLSIRTAGIFLGIVAILFGITRIIGYFSNDLYRLAFENDLILGSLLILIGIALLFRSSRLWETLRMILGFAILTDSMFKFRMALEARRFGLNRWVMILIASVSTCILGLAGIFVPAQGSGTIAIVLGIGILSYAVMNLITVLTAVKTTKAKHSITIEEAGI